MASTHNPINLSSSAFPPPPPTDPPRISSNLPGQQSPPNLPPQSSARSAGVVGFQQSLMEASAGLTSTGADQAFGGVVGSGCLGIGEQDNFLSMLDGGGAANPWVQRSSSDNTQMILQYLSEIQNAPTHHSPFSGRQESVNEHLLAYVMEQQKYGQQGLLGVPSLGSQLSSGLNGLGSGDLSGSGVFGEQIQNVMGVQQGGRRQLGGSFSLPEHFFQQMLSQVEQPPNPPLPQPMKSTAPLYTQNSLAQGGLQTVPENQPVNHLMHAVSASPGMPGTSPAEQQQLSSLLAGLNISSIGGPGDNGQMLSILQALENQGEGQVKDGYQGNLNDVYSKIKAKEDGGGLGLGLACSATSPLQSTSEGYAPTTSTPTPRIPSPGGLGLTHTPDTAGTSPGIMLRSTGAGGMSISSLDRTSSSLKDMLDGQSPEPPQPTQPTPQSTPLPPPPPSHQFTAPAALLLETVTSLNNSNSTGSNEEAKSAARQLPTSILVTVPAASMAEAVAVVATVLKNLGRPGVFGSLKDGGAREVAGGVLIRLDFGRGQTEEAVGKLVRELHGAVLPAGSDLLQISSPESSQLPSCLQDLLSRLGDNPTLSRDARLQAVQGSAISLDADLSMSGTSGSSQTAVGMMVESQTTPVAPLGVAGSPGRVGMGSPNVESLLHQQQQQLHGYQQLQQQQQQMLMQRHLMMQQQQQQQVAQQYGPDQQQLAMYILMQQQQQQQQQMVNFNPAMLQHVLGMQQMMGQVNPMLGQNMQLPPTFPANFNQFGGFQQQQEFRPTNVKVYQNPFQFAGKVVIEDRDTKDYKQSSKRALESNKRGEIDLKSLRVCGFPPIKHNPEKIMVQQKRQAHARAVVRDILMNTMLAMPDTRRHVAHIEDIRVRENKPYALKGQDPPFPPEQPEPPAFNLGGLVTPPANDMVAIKPTKYPDYQYAIIQFDSEEAAREVFDALNGLVICPGSIALNQDDYHYIEQAYGEQNRVCPIPMDRFSTEERYEIPQNIKLCVFYANRKVKPLLGSGEGFLSPETSPGMAGRGYGGMTRWG